MTNEEFIKHLAYHERVMRELHGIKVALEAARAATGLSHKCTCGDYRATGSAPIVDDGRDGWRTHQ